MNVCENCILWVTDDNKKGFCLKEDLFTETNKETCSECIKGKPISEDEWEEYDL